MKFYLIAFLSFVFASSISAQDTTSKIVTKTEAKVYEITELNNTSDNEKYGFSSGMPVKVGTGPKGGPANQRAYLDLLRDPNGNSIAYERLGSCCGYKSENGFLGYAMLDRYELAFKDENGKMKKVVVYISFYDYEEPLILKGFKTVSKN